MKNLKEIFIGISILVISGAIVYYFFQKENPELKYSLSSAIELPKNDSTDESIQQLTINNTGDVIIQNVVIKIKAKVNSFKINKYTESDSIIINQKTDFLEIKYVQLPIDRGITIILSTNKMVINKEQIDISHLNGKAIEAFSTDNQSSPVNWIILIMALLGMLIYFYLIMVNFYEKNIDYNPFEYILLRNKPILLTTNKWLELRKNAIEELFRKEYPIDIDKLKCYQILDQDKPKIISENEWISINENAEKYLKEYVASYIYRRYFIKNDDFIYKLRKPKNISSKIWGEINDYITDSYINKYIRNYRSDNLNLEEFTDDKKPSFFNKEKWDELKSIIIKIFIYQTFYNKIIMNDYKKEFSKVNFDLLSKSEKSSIKQIFETLIEQENSLNYNKELKSILSSVFFWKELPKKPEKINDDDWEQIVKIFKNLIQVQKENARILNELEKENSDTIPLRKKVLKQLKIIDKLLEKPESIDLVEEYDIPFSPGNWENLKKLASILKEVK